jgi:cytochrome c
MQPRSLSQILAVTLLAATALCAEVRIPAVAATADAVPAAGDPARGKELYQGCNACHSIDENDIGPRHKGVVGRKAGSLTDYNYSPALKSSGLTWDATTLDRWLTNPSALVPGTKMYFKLESPKDRADVIAYLQQLK